MSTPSEDVPKEGEEEPKEETNELASEFNFFDLFDGMEHENDKDPSRIANKSDMISLIKFIGGFEKWNELNEDCRMAVVKFLEYKDRCKLGICSKRDYETVKSTPLDVYKISIYDNEKYHYSFREEDFDNVVVEVQLHHDFNSGKRFELIFSQLGEDTQIQWYQYIPKQRPKNRSLVLKSCNYYEEAVKFAEKWMKKCNFELKDIKIEMKNYPMDKSKIKSLPKCKCIRIGSDDVETFRWWLQKVPNQLKDVELVALDADREVFTIPSDLLNAPQIMQTSDFYFWCRAEFSDEQLLNLKASSLSFDCVNITDGGINEYIKRWINGKGVPKFKRALLWGNKARDYAELTRGLEYRQWDAAFEEEAAGFCGDFERVCGRGNCVQIYSKIDPYESLTLNVSSDCVAIYWTGHKHEYNGRTYSDYSIP
ncbi:hypothetical protein L3Y34_002044 [Caenorhabditis briggsae]|uniref:F-box associated domain-containing protein n=3 Tax=Caenorhabditis briggsae TaxID=6238 RepID=A0AAE9IR71_CAEBR|nr:hypothetical protein L3Y34_002044 [Caenorhabditis briggsae]